MLVLVLVLLLLLLLLLRRRRRRRRLRRLRLSPSRLLLPPTTWARTSDILNHCSPMRTWLG